MRLHLDYNAAVLHISTRYPKDRNQFGAVSGISDLAPSLEGKLIEERETLYAQLKETCGKLVRIILWWPRRVIPI